MSSWGHRSRRRLACASAVFFWTSPYRSAVRVSKWLGRARYPVATQCSLQTSTGHPWLQGGSLQPSRPLLPMHVLIGKPRIDRPADPPHRARRDRGVASGQQRCVDGSGRRFNTRSHVNTVEMVFAPQPLRMANPSTKPAEPMRIRPIAAQRAPCMTRATQQRFPVGVPGTLPSSWAPVRL